MLLEKIIFNLLAFSLFIIIFFKIIRRNDTNYIFLLVLQAFGITISFFEISIGVLKKLEFFRSSFFFGKMTKKRE